jgi:hypothetical protein
MSPFKALGIIRTRLSSLTDEELILMDPMFDTHVSRYPLLSENYQEMFNTGYSHGLAAQELDAVLGRLQQGDLIATADNGGTIYYGLTAKGGPLWEAERRPAWESFCTASEDGRGPNGLCSLKIVAFSREVGAQYLCAARECGLYPLLDLTRVAWTVASDLPIYWTGQPSTLVAPTSEDITGDILPGNGAVTYALNPVGNRTSRSSTLMSLPSATYSYDVNDRLTTDGYDANGNTVTRDGATYTYDCAGRLKSKNGSEVTVVYDGDGARVAKTAGGVTTQYLVDDLNPSGYAQVLEEVVGGVVQRVYTTAACSSARAATWAAAS